MIGLNRQGVPIDPCSLLTGSVFGGINCNEVNPAYMYSGEPVNEIGWINTVGEDQRMCINTGPFSLEVEKPITIIVGYTMGQGIDPLNSVTAGIEVSAFVQKFYKSNFDDNILTVDEESNLVVDDFKLYQNYPNPFNPSTTISYQIPQQEFVTLKVYDILGNEIAVLVNENETAGNYEVNFNASSLPSGIYFYQIKAGSFIETKKMVLVK
ncbi:MAG: T9SS type A sorting domain-containing protein [Ignavibacteriaceae bacterium]|nr:T9SS type A sorting domain-containing protein [Ignavibacteriaceae bacterium]